ncbi:glycosyltransferase family 8 protein [Miniphocaeibacter halophilus]|uniref:Glycosyltransferase family 8 protein n=1 Tax=Miniphocaeibacter halophilus TaxID=2931922 RepID=A0AC61MNL9_9FIRM|nr:glycosyltransferase family 8 protein [Miniphocaeibacter halophilus]QQK07137.1 glycosyltransferase family 8 protein [Miniphocaeibacter halophilus]
MESKIDILVTLDENYLNPLKVMLTSLYYNNPNESFNIWLIHERIPEEKINNLRKLTDFFHWKLNDIKIDNNLLGDAPTKKQYPKEMYFRLLAGEIIPNNINKILYLDPDILIINPIIDLWNTDLGDYMIAASTHTGMTDITTEINKIRLWNDNKYYNSGIMLMDLRKTRELIKLKDIIDTIDKYGNQLLLPDQDVLNFLYSQHIKEVAEEIWNYDTRKYLTYFTRSLSKHNLQWVMENTSILHFCGRPKPWDPKSNSKFTALYLNYKQLLNRIEKNY